jgi:putative aldouronate transport system substrate-binding protein
MSNVAKHDKKTLSRRAFFQVTAAAAGTTVIAACGGTTTTPLASVTPLATTIPAAQATATIAAAIGKTYFPSGSLDIPDAFTAPLPAYQSVEHVPGTGNTVTGFSMIYVPLPTALGQNKFWQQFNKTLNINWQPTFATSDAYAEKSSVLVASNNPPDIFVIWPESVPALYTAISQGAFLDLTSQLTGSALEKFPNLARISPKVWKNSRIGGKLYGVPRARPLVGQALFVRNDWLQQVGITAPKDANEFYTLMTEISKGKLNNGQQTWGLGSLGQAPGSLSGSNGDVGPWIFSMFGVPNNYRLESNGSLTYYLNTQEFLDSMAYLRKLYQAGVFYPDALSMTTTKAKTNFAAGKFAGYWDGINAIASANGLQAQVQTANPKGEVGMLTPPGAQGGKPTFWLGQGNFARAAIPATVTDDNKVQELLRILDYWAAPAFSTESNFLLYGIDGWDNTINAKGVRKQSAAGHSESVTGLAYMMNGPSYFYTPDDPPLAVKMQQYVVATYPTGVSDPTLGLYSPTATKQTTVLSELYKDRFLHIITGAAPVSSATEMYNDWLKNGGTQILKEYSDALSKNS